MTTIKDLLQTLSDNPSLELRIRSGFHNHSIRVIVGNVSRRSGHEFLLEELNQRTDAEERVGYVIQSLIKEVNGNISPTSTQ
jgi:RNA binding exosome subunit